MRLKKVTFVLTSTIRRSFEMMRLAVSQKWPILLHGPPGAGKSASILQLAEASGKKGTFMSFYRPIFWRVKLKLCILRSFMEA